MDIIELADSLDWMNDFRKKYAGGIAHTFLFHGAISDYVGHLDNAPVRLNYFLKQYLSTKKDVVVIYNYSNGITFAKPSMRKNFLEAALVDNQSAVDDGSKVLSNPSTALMALETALLHTHNEPDFNMAIIIEEPELLWSQSDYNQLNDEEKKRLSTIKRWATADEFAATGNLIILTTPIVSNIHETLRTASSQIEQIEISYPDFKARLEFINKLLETNHNIELDENMTSTMFASLTGGLSRALIQDVVSRAKIENKKINVDLIKDKKDQIIKEEFGDVIEIIEPSHGFNDIGGMEEIKKYLELSVVAPLKNTELKGRMPSGVLLTGPPGTGKCIVGDSLIKTNKGLIQIKDIPLHFDIVGNEISGCYLESLNLKNLTFEYKKASRWYDLGIHKTIKITTENNSLEGTYKHPIIVFEDHYFFSELQNLQVGDLVAIRDETDNIRGMKLEKIIKLEYQENQVYDFTVEDNHSFISNNFISHNTFLVSSLGFQAGVSVVKLNVGRLLGQYVGNSEANLEKALACIRSLVPTIVMIDEIEQQFQRGTGSDGGVERRIFGRILEEMSGSGGTKRGDIVWFAATNRIDLLDPALRRPGRFDKIVPVLPPSAQARWNILSIKLKKSNMQNLSEQQAKDIVAKTEDYTGADLDGVIIKATELAYDNNRQHLIGEDVINALEVLRPSSSHSERESMINSALEYCNDLSLVPENWREYFKNLEEE